MSNNVEREIFEGLVNALTRQNSIKEEIKDIAARAKEYELDIKAIKAAATFYVANNYEEKSLEFARIKEAYELLAD
ncbi:hypothetical protein D3C71_1812960 [compost metagenome]